MTKTKTKATTTIGCDLGDKTSHVCILDEHGDVLERGTFTTTKRGVEKFFSKHAGALVVVEAGTHSRWVSTLVKQLGCEVLVGNPRHVRLIYGGTTKTDKFDAEALGRLGRLDPRLLHPVEHRSADAQADLSVIRSRDALVKTRTMLVNHVRSLVKTMGERLASCDAESFAKKVREHIPAELAPALTPVLDVLDAANQQIRSVDKLVEQMCQASYPETQRLLQVPGVGPVTALTFVLTIEDPKRFADARKIGSYLGMVPRKDQSGGKDPHLRITKAGNGYLRRVLVNCAHYITGQFGPDSDLRRFGQRLAPPGSTTRKKRAVVAVARKLAVLLLRLWTTGEDYVPLGHGKKAAA
jgi:transposase